MSPSRSDELAYIHTGSFSGSADGLAAALRARTRLVSVDLHPASYDRSTKAMRLASGIESRLAGGGVPLTKTGAWSVVMERLVGLTDVLVPERPALFIQSIPAFRVADGIRYGVYTDRVGIEGAASGGAHVSLDTPWWRRRERAHLQRAHRVFVMGPSSVEFLVRDYGIDPARVVVVAAGPNVVLGAPRRSAACRRLVFVGLEWERKGGPELLAAFERVRVDHPDLELVVAGDTPPPGPLPAGVEVRGRVARDQMDALYDDADALVIPTHHEPFGIALVEALQKGLPVIGTSIANQAWIIGDGGICVPPGDVDALAGALDDLVRNYPTWRARAAVRGAVLRAQFSWDHVADQILHELAAP